jgi:hypothetical protein
MEEKNNPARALRQVGRGLVKKLTYTTRSASSTIVLGRRGLRSQPGTMRTILWAFRFTIAS